MGCPVINELELWSGASFSISESDDKWCMVAHMPRTNMSDTLGEKEQAVGGDESAVETVEDRS